MFSEKKTIKNDLLASYDSILDINETKPMFLTNVISQTNKKLKKLKIKSICDNIIQIQTLNTLPTTDYSNFIESSEKKIIERRKELKMIPNLPKEKILENINKTKESIIKIERSDFRMI